MTANGEVQKESSDLDLVDEEGRRHSLIHK